MDKKTTPAPDELQQTTYQVTVRRGSSTEWWYDRFEVPAVPGQSVLGALQYIFDNLDPSLAFTCSCRIGLCGGCMLRVNGKAAHACTTILRGDIRIEPQSEARVARDLVLAEPQR